MEIQKTSSWRPGSIELIALAIALVFWAAYADWLGFSPEFFSERVSNWFYLLPLAWLLLMFDLYDVNKAANWRKTIRGVAISAFLGFVVYSLIYLFSDPGSLPRRGIAAFMLSVSLLTLLWRWIYIRIFTAPRFMRRLLLVGGGKAGKTVLRAISNHQPQPFDLIGIIDDDSQKVGSVIDGYPVLAQSDKLLEISAQEEITDIIVAISGEMQGATFQTLLDAQERGARS